MGIWSIHRSCLVCICFWWKMLVDPFQKAVLLLVGCDLVFLRNKVSLWHIFYKILLFCGLNQQKLQCSCFLKTDLTDYSWVAQGIVDFVQLGLIYWKTNMVKKVYRNILVPR